MSKEETSYEVQAYLLTGVAEGEAIDNQDRPGPRTTERHLYDAHKLLERIIESKDIRGEHRHRIKSSEGEEFVYKSLKEVKQASKKILDDLRERAARLGFKLRQYNLYNYELEYMDEEGGPMGVDSRTFKSLTSVERYLKANTPK